MLAIAGRQADGPGPAYLSNAALAAFPIMYVVGLHALRQTRARVADVILAARDGIDRSEWDRLVRQSLNDRDARVLWKHPSTDHFVDSRGRDIGAAPPGSFAVISRGHQIAALVHDSASGAKRDLLESLGESLRLTTENERLARELERSLVQVRESRERMVGATDEARRRIERDLHDGAQQLLLTAALTVENARRRALDGNDPELVQTLATATSYLAMARRELRELAHGLTPAVLDHGGLEGALEELALRCPVPTTVDVCGGRRPEGVTEVTVFFMVAECLTNIARHSDADAAAVRVTTEDGVCVTVADNGRGGASIGPGGGLAGLIDRVEAVGGTLTVASPPGHGTTVTATIPSRMGAPG